MEEYAIIVAGGVGTRMNQTIPKQFLLLKGIPILMHTISRFTEYNSKLNIILGLPGDQFDYWNKLCKEYKFTTKHSVVRGGQSRFQTVKNCLSSIDDSEGIVAIHDGVRPLIKPNTIAASFKLADKMRGAVASVRLKETIRFIDQDGSKSTDRSKFRVVQTPQTFHLGSLKKAYESREETWMTDDASVAEQFGIKISLFEGGYENVKITTPEDLIIAEALIDKDKP